MAALGATVIRAGRRFLSSLPALFGVLVFTFLLMRVLPGDPAVFFASGPNAGKEEIEVIRKQMGLNKPVPEQLMLYLYDVGSGNLGRSMMTGQLVTKDLRERLPASLELTFTALLIALLSAVPLACAGGAEATGSIIDHGVRVFLRARRRCPDVRFRAVADRCLLSPARLHPSAPAGVDIFSIHAAKAVRVPVIRLPARRRFRWMVGSPSCRQPPALSMALPSAAP